MRKIGVGVLLGIISILLTSNVYAWRDNTSWNQGDLKMDKHSIDGDPVNGLVIDSDSDGTNEFTFEADGDFVISSGDILMYNDLSVKGNLTVGSNVLYVDNVLGNVGIGDTTPDAKLNIIGADSADILIVENVTTSTVMIVAEDGNVGVGWSTPTAKLHVVDLGTETNNIGSQHQHSSSFANNGVNAALYGLVTNQGTTAAGTGHGIGVLGIAADGVNSLHPLFGVEGRVNADSTSSGLVHTGTLGKAAWTDPDSGDGSTYAGILYGLRGQCEVLDYDGVTGRTEGTLMGCYIDPIKGGNVGYGVYVKDQTGSTTDVGMALEGADTVTLWVGSAADNFDAANGIFWGATASTNLYMGALNELKTDDSVNIVGDLTVDGGTLYVDNAAGNVGIGDSTPESKLKVQGDIYASGDVSATGAINVGGDVNVTSNLTVDSTTLIVNSSTNNVGIGTAAPSHELHVYEASGPTTIAVETDSGEVDFVMDGAATGAYGTVMQQSFRNAGDSVAAIFSKLDVSGNADSGTLDFFTQATGGGNTLRMRVMPEGDVDMSYGLTVDGAAVFMPNLPSGATEPSGVLAGQLWYDTDDQIIKMGT